MKAYWGCEEEEEVRGERGREQIVVELRVFPVALGVGKVRSSVDRESQGCLRQCCYENFLENKSNRA